jgi:hypothetical protein
MRPSTRLSGAGELDLDVEVTEEEAVRGFGFQLQLLAMLVDVQQPVAAHADLGGDGLHAVMADMVLEDRRGEDDRPSAGVEGGYLNRV